MNHFSTEFTLSPKDAKMDELAHEYHRDCEAYDASVCSANVRGEATPTCPRELALVNRNASRVLQEVLAKAAAEGIDAKDMRRAISRASRV